MKKNVVNFCVGLAVTVTAGQAMAGWLSTSNTASVDKWVIAVPGAEGKGITLKALMESYDLCLAGDKENRPEVTSLLEKIARIAGMGAANENGSSVMRDSEYQPSASIKGGIFTPATDTSYSTDEKSTQGYATMEFKELNWQKDASGTLKCLEGGNCAVNDIATQNLFRKKGTQVLKSDRLLVLLAGESGSETEVKQVALISEQGTVLPTFAYKTMVKDSDYDSMGQHIPEQTIVQGLTIEAPASMKAPVMFVNARTLKPTKVSVDFQEFISCISSEASKRLK